jgi:hypothetical protein
MSFLQTTPLIDVAMAGVYPLDVDEVNRLLIEWGHKLGACRRPFRSEGFGLSVHGRIVAVAMSCSIVNGPVAGYLRTEVVELARLAASEPWANRVMLRLWREVCAPGWRNWPVKAAVSYSHNAMHSGNLYRFDGWRKVRDDCGSSGGGAWSRKRYCTDAVHGKKTLWIYEYTAQPPERRVAA